MIAERLAQVKMNIEHSIARRKHSDMPAQVELVAVTKNHDIHAMQEAIDAGVLRIGENRIQEAEKKAAILGRNVSWHLIGHLQTNKVKQAVGLFDLIHSVDSEKLLLEINRIAQAFNKVQNILIQVNIAREDRKFGVPQEDAAKLAKLAGALDHVLLRGLMTIAPHYEDAEMTRPVFREMYALFTELQNMKIPNTDIQCLSMGMSNDYEVAVEEGANIVRIGTGIFGQRQY